MLMKTSEENQYVKNTLGHLMIQQTRLTTQLDITSSILLDIISKHFPDISQNVYTNYVNELERATLEDLEDLNECLLDFDPAWRLKYKQSLYMEFQSMKQHKNYRHADSTK